MSPRLARLAVALLVVWGFALRAWLAWPEPNRHRFWDERFALENIVHLLREGSWAPVNGYHPALSWLPTGTFLVAARAGHEAIRPEAGDPFLRPNRGQRPALYRTGRLFHAALGALSIWLAWRIGRTIGGRTTGVLAAAFTAFLPRHVLHSCILNEDMPLVVGCQVALLASAAAVRGGRMAAFVRAGVAIGAALATKFIAAPVSLPLAAVATRLPLGAGARLRRVATAAGVAAVTLLAVSPHLVLAPEMYRQDFGETSRLYRVKEATARPVGGHVVLDGLATLAGDRYFGPAGALLATLGIAAAIRASRRRPASWRRSAAVPALFPIFFFAVYGLATGHARPHAWLPVAPVVAVFAAFGGRELLRRSARRRAPAGVLLAALGLLVALGAPVAEAHAMAYEQTTPTCAEVLLRQSRSAVRGSAPRLVAVDRSLLGELGGDGPLRGDRTAYVSVDVADQASLAGRFDALLQRADGPSAIGSDDGRRCEPALLRARGSAARLFVSPPRKLRPRPLAARAVPPGAIAFEVPPGDGAARLEIRVPRRFERELARGRIEARLELGGERLPFHGARDTRGGPMLVSEPFAASSETRAARLVLASRDGWMPGRFSVRLWSPARPGEGARAPADQSPASSSSSSPRSASASAAAAKSPGIRSPGRGR